MRFFSGETQRSLSLAAASGKLISGLKKLIRTNLTRTQKRPYMVLQLRPVEQLCKHKKKKTPMLGTESLKQAGSSEPFANLILSQAVTLLLFWST